MLRSARFVSLLGYFLLSGLLVACFSDTPTATPRPAAPPTGSKVARSVQATAQTELPATTAPNAQTLPTQSADSQPTSAPEATAPPPTAVPPTSAPLAQPPKNYFGASTNGEILNDDQVRSLAILAGVQMVRTSILWKGVEKARGSYNWDYPDDAFNRLVTNHFEPLVLILDNPDWAAKTICGPVDDLPAFEAFLSKLAARYPDVHYWALYNEPDNAAGPDHSTGGCFGGGDLNQNGKPDVEDYAQELAIAWRAIHQANPNAQLVMGAVAFDNFDQATAPEGYPGGGNGGLFNSHFLEQLFAYMQANPLAAGEKYFDVLGFNYYGIYGPFWQRTAGGIGLSAKVNALQKLLRQYGLQAGLLVSETGDDSVRLGNDGQSEYAVKTFVRGLASGVTHIIWWTFQDFPDSNPPPSNTWKYGLIDQNASPKPSYAAYQNMVQELSGASYVQPLQVEGGEGYVFDKGGAKAVLWSSSDTPVTLAFSAHTLQVKDMYGAVRAVPDGSADDKDGTVGRIGLQVDAHPVYVQVAE